MLFLEINRKYIGSFYMDIDIMANKNDKISGKYALKVVSRTSDNKFLLYMLFYLQK